jgi:hypothetical protein
MKTKSMLLAALAVLLIGGAAGAGTVETFVGMTCLYDTNRCPQQNPLVFQTAEECKRIADQINRANPPSKGGVSIKCFKKTAPTTTFEPIE